MEHQLYAVYDSKAEAFLPPFIMPNTATALRAFKAAAENEQHQFYAHAADYTLFGLGYFDDSTGKIQSLDVHENLGTALTLRENES